MSAWNKTVFNHTLITSQFLNDLQDYIISRGPMTVLFNESAETVPPGSNVTEYLDIQGLVNGMYSVGGEFVPMAGDLLIGIQSGNVGVVLDYDAEQEQMTVRGAGLRIGSGS